MNQNAKDRIQGCGTKGGGSDSTAKNLNPGENGSKAGI